MLNREQSTMTPRDFCYWLQGFFELNSVVATRGLVAGFSLTAEQVEMIRKHLYVVFKHECESVQLNDVIKYEPLPGQVWGDGIRLTEPLNTLPKRDDGQPMLMWPSGPAVSC